MITQRLMRSGQWELPLREDTPQELLTQLNTTGAAAYSSKLYGHIYITPAWWDRNEFTATTFDTLLTTNANTIFAGVWRGISNLRVLDGTGLDFWLGDEDGKSSSIQLYAPPGANQTFNAWINAMIPVSLNAGSIEAIAGNIAWSDPIPDGWRDKWAYICRFKGAEWRVNRDLTVDAGTIAYLYSTVPKAIFGELNSFGVEPPGTYRGIKGKIDHRSHGDNYYTGVWAYDPTPAFAFAGRATVPYNDQNGSPLVLTRYVSDSSPVPAPLANQATAWLLWDGFVEDEYHITEVEVYDPITEIGEIGEYVYLFDPHKNLYSTLNNINHGGEQVFPVAKRIIGYQWAPKPGMGVYLRYYDNSIFAYNHLDLTRFIDWDQLKDVKTTVEVAALSTTWGTAVRNRYINWVN